ncbi:uncharacterized protein LOC141617307 [Silene latifolia]|uniref:uncharacterized protein LOC141617307 n=1 Tax=Silene latifolia TaxID=37657 RepID=UPI003D76E833
MGVSQISGSSRNEPWLWTGDFNTILSPVETLGGNSTNIEMEHFQECVSLCCMEDLQATGALFTWSNKQIPKDRVYSRLDRAMGNFERMEEFGEYMAHFHPEGLFDHCPRTIVDRKIGLSGRRCFKYFNMWGQAEEFIKCVGRVWNKRQDGTKMFKVVKKLKELKPMLKKLNKIYFSDIKNCYAITGTLLEKIQKDIIDRPGDLELMQQKHLVAQELKDLLAAWDNFLVQKTKIKWSLEGDINSAYFPSIEDQYGTVCSECELIQNVFLDYYQTLLGSHSVTDSVNTRVVRRGKCCTVEH